MIMYLHNFHMSTGWTIRVNFNFLNQIWVHHFETSTSTQTSLDSNPGLPWRMIETNEGNDHSERKRVCEILKRAKTILPSIATMAKLTKTSTAMVFIVQSLEGLYLMPLS